MEHSEGYKSVQERIRVLEQTLSKCGEAVQHCEKSGEEAVKDIEEQFAKSFNALAERKTVLLKEVQARVTNKKQKIEESAVELKTSIEAYKQTLAGAVLVYSLNKNSAESICKELTNMDIPKVGSSGVRFQFPASLLTDIQNYGDVTDAIVGADCYPVAGFYSGTDMGRFFNVDNVTTFAGSTEGHIDGNGANAKMNCPWGVCFNPLDDCMYIGDHSNNAIKKVSMQGDVITFAQENGLLEPCGIIFNSKTNDFFVANHSGHSISRITASGKVSVLAGSGKGGNKDGIGANARFCFPIGMTIDPATGDLYVCDHGNHAIRKISPQGEVSTLAGSGVAGCADGMKHKALFTRPWGICFVKEDQSLLVCDCGNNKLRKVLLNGTVSTMCAIDKPNDVVITDNKSIIITSQSNKLYKLSLQGSQKYVAEVLAGTGSLGKEDGKANDCSFTGIAVHEASQSCFVTGHYTHTVCKISFSSR